MPDNKTVREEIPDTIIGIKQYIGYCERAIHENKLHIKRLETRIEWRKEKLGKIDANPS